MSNNLQAMVAALESKVDLMEAELSYLNRILIRCGFPQGIKTLKATVEELITEGGDSISPEQPKALDF